jgi:hypothetical protein
LRPATAASGPTWAPRDKKTPFCDAMAGGDDGFIHGGLVWNRMEYV